MALEDGEIVGPVALADRLDHLDRHDMVVLALDVAVVAKLQFDPVGQARATQSRARILELLARDGDGRDAHAAPGRRLGEAAPAAADLQDAVALLGVDLGEDAVVFGGLRRFQRLARLPFVERRGVAHRRVEPQSVEAVAEIVVGVDVAFRAFARVVPAAMQDPESEIVQDVGVRHAAQRPLVVGQERDQFGQVGRIAVAVHVGFGESDVSIKQDAAEQTPILDVQRRLALGAGRAERAMAAVGQTQRKAADGKVLKRLEDEMGGEGYQRVTYSGGGAGLR